MSIYKTCVSMYCRVCAVAIVVACCWPCDAQSRTIIGDPPALGVGFDRNSQTKTKVSSCIQFKESQAQAGERASSFFSELDLSSKSKSETNADVSVAYQDVFKVSLGIGNGNEEKRKYRAVVGSSVIVTKRLVAGDVKLSVDLSRLSADSFREKYGTGFVSAVDYGGVASAAIRVSSSERDDWEKGKAALQLWFIDAKFDLNGAVSHSKVKSETRIAWHLLGGKISGLPDIATKSFKESIGDWVPTVAEHPSPIVFQVTPYEDVIEDFPFRFPFVNGVTVETIP